MRRNVGTIEGMWRAGFGGVALAAGLRRGNPVLLGLSAIALGTAFSGYCPASRLLGVDTASGDRAALPGGEQGPLASQGSSAAG